MSALFQIAVCVQTSQYCTRVFALDAPLRALLFFLCEFNNRENIVHIMHLLFDKNPCREQKFIKGAEQQLVQNLSEEKVYLSFVYMVVVSSNKRLVTCYFIEIMKLLLYVGICKKFKAWL